MKKTPFKMQQKTKLEKWRADTFWTKEPETIKWIDGFSGGVFYDIGANVGVYSLYCASVHPDMSVMAVEPQWQNYLPLCSNINENGFNIKPVAAGVGARSGLFGFSGYEKIAGASGGQVCFDLKLDGFDVFLYTLDSIIGKYVDGVPDYIKIDIDGQELAVLQGATETLKTVKSVLVEAHIKDLAEIASLMMQAGFAPDPKYNLISPHSRERRKVECISEENIIYTKKELL